MKKYKYWSWMPWMRWFVPLPILIMISKKMMGNHHVWYQDDCITLETSGRFSDQCMHFINGERCKHTCKAGNLWCAEHK
jgi:hypothetical protein